MAKKRKRARRKAMTGAQRAALRKAQLASARKRRRRGRAKVIAKAGLGLAGSVAGSAALYHVNSYARNPSKAVKDYKAAKSYIQRRRKPLTPALKSKTPNLDAAGFIVRGRR